MKRDQKEQFRARAEAVGASVSERPDLESAFAFVMELAQRTGAKEIAAAGWAGDAGERLSAMCKDLGIAQVPRDLRNRPDGVAIGLTPAKWGVAETGTIVLDSRSEKLRLATMLSEIHVAVLPESGLVDNLEAIETELSSILKNDPAYLAFITGASRTADIERVLTIGVHGPRELYILITGEDWS